MSTITYDIASTVAGDAAAAPLQVQVQHALEAVPSAVIVQSVSVGAWPIVPGAEISITYSGEALTGPEDTAATAAVVAHSTASVADVTEVLTQIPIFTVDPNPGNNAWFAVAAAAITVEEGRLVRGEFDVSCVVGTAKQPCGARIPFEATRPVGGSVSVSQDSQPRGQVSGFAARLRESTASTVVLELRRRSTPAIEVRGNITTITEILS